MKVMREGTACSNSEDKGMTAEEKEEEEGKKEGTWGPFLHDRY